MSDPRGSFVAMLTTNKFNYEFVSLSRMRALSSGS